MKMIKKIVFAFMLTALAGCTVTKSPQAEVKFTEHTADTIAAGKAAAEKYMQNFTGAIKADNPALLNEVLPADSSKRLNRAKFADMQKWLNEKLGTLEKVVFVDLFRQGAICDYLWKLSFKRADGVETDAAYFVRVVSVEGKTEIVKAGFSFR